MRDTMNIEKVNEESWKIDGVDVKEYISERYTFGFAYGTLSGIVIGFIISLILISLGVLK